MTEEHKKDRRRSSDAAPAQDRRQRGDDRRQRDSGPTAPMSRAADAPAMVAVPLGVRKFFRGTATPLASIFGSGFLVIVSVLGGAVGPYAFWAMAGICFIAYFVGTVIRHNIIHAEPLIVGGKAKHSTVILEEISDFALVIAYIISVMLYIRILTSYGLAYFEIDTERNQQVLTTGIILFILFIGTIKGLKSLENLEVWALGTTFAIIAVLIAAFAFHDAQLLAGGEITLPDFPEQTAWHVLTVLAGTLIVVQGFETPRYLSESFDSDTRVRASRNSQYIATGIYLLFVGLSTPLLHHLAGEEVKENGLMEIAGIVAVWLPAPLVLAALFSQFSAATADVIAGAGNLQEALRHRLKIRTIYWIICLSAIALNWTANIIEVLVYASKAFAFYYFLQCLVAFTTAANGRRKAFFLVMGAMLLFITVFAVPVH